MSPETSTTAPRGSDRWYLAVQLLVIPVATFFAVEFNEPLLRRIRAIQPNYPNFIVMGLPGIPWHTAILHHLGPGGLLAIALVLTVAIAMFTFVGSRAISTFINRVLLVFSLLFFVGVLASYVIALLSLTFMLGAGH
jgi:hypothetical protein